MKRKQQKGSAILTVLGIVSIVSIVCGFLGFAATQQMHASKITREMLKARLIAESGLNKAYHTVKKDFSKVSSCSETATFGDGTYKVTSATSVGGNANRAQLVSEGVCGLGRAVVSADIENRPKTTSDGNTADDYFNLLFDLLVGGTLDLKGNFYANVNAIHANGNASISGSAYADSKTVSAQAR